MDNGTFILVSLMVYVILVAPDVAVILNQIFSIDKEFKELKTLFDKRMANPVTKKDCGGW